MKKQSTTKTAESSLTWETLEAWIRGHVQQFIQHVLEEEVTDLLGRQKSVRRRGGNGPTGYRNGYGKPRRLTLSCGTLTVRRPRVRECDERLVSRVLPFFKRKAPPWSISCPSCICMDWLKVTLIWLLVDC